MRDARRDGTRFLVKQVHPPPGVTTIEASAANTGNTTGC